MWSGSTIAAALVFLAATGSAAWADEISDMARDADRIASEARAFGLERLLPGAQRADSNAEALRGSGGAPPSPAMSVPAGSPVEHRLSQRYAFLVSFADDAVVRVAIERARARADVVVVFRGFPDDDFAGLSRRLHAVLGASKDVPPIAIDPRIYRRFGVDAVPATVDLESGDIVRGLVSVEALQARPGGGGSTVLGPVRPVLERDLADVLREKAAAIDPKAAFERAQDGFWREVKFVGLPVARVAAERRVEPTVYLQQDLVGAEGEVIAKAGTPVNPLETVPLHLTLIVFDGTDPAQVAVAKDEADRAASPVLITTALDRVARWDGVAALQAAVGRPIYLLDATLQRRLYLERVPTVVTGEGKDLVLREVPVEEVRP